MIDAESQGATTANPTADRIRVLADQHHALDERLHELATHRYLTDTEALEEARLKKRKLALKDAIVRLRHES